MTDLTDSQKVERGRRAQMALEEFFDPAFDAVIEAYAARIEEIASTTPWDAQKITAVANAARIAKQLRNQIIALVYEGEQVRRDMIRVEEIEKLSPAKRRFLNMAPL